MQRARNTSEATDSSPALQQPLADLSETSNAAETQRGEATVAAAAASQDASTQPDRPDAKASADVAGREPSAANAPVPHANMSRRHTSDLSLLTKPRKQNRAPGVDAASGASSDVPPRDSNSQAQPATNVQPAQDEGRLRSRTMPLPDAMAAAEHAAALPLHAQGSGRGPHLRKGAKAPPPLALPFPPNSNKAEARKEVPGPVDNGSSAAEPRARRKVHARQTRESDQPAGEKLTIPVPSSAAAGVQVAVSSAAAARTRAGNASAEPVPHAVRAGFDAAAASAAPTPTPSSPGGRSSGRPSALTSPRYDTLNKSMETLPVEKHGAAAASAGEVSDDPDASGGSAALPVPRLSGISRVRRSPRGDSGAERGAADRLLGGLRNADKRHNSLDMASLKKVREKVAERHRKSLDSTFAANAERSARSRGASEGADGTEAQAAALRALAAGPIPGDGPPALEDDENGAKPGRRRSRTLAHLGDAPEAAGAELAVGGVLGLEGALKGRRKGGGGGGGGGGGDAPGASSRSTLDDDTSDAPAGGDEVSAAAARQRLANALLLAMHPAPHFQAPPVPLDLKAVPPSGEAKGAAGIHTQSLSASKTQTFESTDLGRALRLLDATPTLETHKIGVVYVGSGQQSGAEILQNTHGSLRYTAFLDSLGDMVRLKGSREYCGGLDREEDRDGEFTYLWKDALTAVVFHVATLMPTSLEEPRQIHKTRYIGNDHVTIVYNDGDMPFCRDWLSGAVNFVYIIVEVRWGGGKPGQARSSCFAVLNLTMLTTAFSLFLFRSL